MSTYQRSATRSPGLRFLLAGAPGSGVEPLRAALVRKLESEGWADTAEVDDLTPQLLDPRDAGWTAAPPHVVLLLGLDALPYSERRAAVSADTRLREALQRMGWAYGVVYGRSDEQRLSAAWQLVRAALPQAQDAKRPPGDDLATRLRPCCPECLVPECEHRLFGFLKDR